MVWTSKDLPKCPVSREDRGEFMKPVQDATAPGDEDPQVIAVARAIAEHGIGRPWDDFLPLNAHDMDQGDLIEYARAAVAVLRAELDEAMAKIERLRAAPADVRAAVIEARRLADSLENRAEDLRLTALNGRDMRFVKLLEKSAAALRALFQSPATDAAGCSHTRPHCNTPGEG